MAFHIRNLQSRFFTCRQIISFAQYTSHPLAEPRVANESVSTNSQKKRNQENFPLNWVQDIFSVEGLSKGKRDSSRHRISKHDRFKKTSGYKSKSSRWNQNHVSAILKGLQSSDSKSENNIVTRVNTSEKDLDTFSCTGENSTDNPAKDSASSPYSTGHSSAPSSSSSDGGSSVPPPRSPEEKEDHHKNKSKKQSELEEEYEKEENLLYMEKNLIETLPLFFKKAPDIHQFAENVVLENNYYEKPEIIVGKTHYLGFISKIRIYGMLKYTFIRVNILNSTCDLNTNSVRIRWRILGLTQTRMMMRPFTYMKPWKLKTIPDRVLEKDATWHDGISTYYLNEYGKICKHVVDKVERDRDSTPAKKRPSLREVIEQKLKQARAPAA